MNFQRVQSTLEKAGVIFEPGLSLREILQIEARYQFHFPPDYRAFLMFALPISNNFINWRKAEDPRIQEMLMWPLEGMCFDIEHNNFWLPAWGPKPAQTEEAFATAKDAVRQAPVLIPILGHRYIPAEPEEAGNPIFSVYQTDIIYYGRNLLEFFENEFGYYFFGESRFQITEPIKPINFWSYLIDINNGAIDG